MANEIASEVLVLEANTGTTLSPTWVQLVCLTDKEISASTSNVEITTDCNDGFVTNKPGKKSWSMTFSGYANSNPGAGEGSYETTYGLWDARTETEFRIRNSDNSYYRQGIGYLSDISESSSAGDYLQFSGTISGTGVLTDTPST